MKSVMLFAKLLSILCLVGLPRLAFTQSSLVIENIASVVIPTGKLAEKDSANGAVGFGDFLRLGYFLANDFRIDLEAGILTIGQNSETLLKARAFLIPIRLNGTYYLLNGDVRPFASLGIGYSPTIIQHYLN